MKRLLSILLAAAMLLSLGLSVSAADSVQDASITYREIRIELNGLEIIPKDANGKTVEPFLMNGTTYLPVRAVAEAMGLSAAWDGATSTVTLTSGAKPRFGSGTAAASRRSKNVRITYRGIRIVIDGQQIRPRDANGNPTEPFLMDGTTYLPVRAVAEALGVAVAWDGVANTVYLGERIKYVPTKTQNWYIEDGVKYEQSCEASTYDAMGRLLKVSYNGGDYTSLTENSYDLDGNLSAEVYTTSYDGVETVRTTTYSYDRSGRLVQLDSTEHMAVDNSFDYEHTMDTIRTELYTYDVSGNLTCQKGKSVITTQFPGEAATVDSYLWSNSYTYDGNNVCRTRVDSEITDYFDGLHCEHDATTAYDEYGSETYFEARNLRREAGSSSTELRRQYTSCQYDAKGNLLSRITTDPDLPEYYDSCISEYDARGNLICRRLVWNSGGYSTASTETYSYDDRGNMLSCCTEFSDDYGSGVTWQRCSYDEGGRLLSCTTSTQESGNPGVQSFNDTSTTYSYGANGMDCTVTTTYGSGYAEITSTVYRAILLS